jgi:hypothetical protein
MREWVIDDKIIDTEIPKFSEEACHLVTLSSTNPLWTALELNPGLSGEI